MWEREWKKHIGGYGVAIDFTARNIQEEAKAKGLPWTTAKGRLSPIHHILTSWFSLVMYPDTTPCVSRLQSISAN